MEGRERLWKGEGGLKFDICPVPITTMFPLRLCGGKLLVATVQADYALTTTTTTMTTDLYKMWSLASVLTLCG